MARVHFSRCLSSGLALAAFVAVLMGSLTAKTVAQGKDDDSRFSAHLASGEFGPALRMAQSASDAASRDARLARVAESQVNAGSRFASLNTAQSVRNDRSRGSLLDRVGSQPFFGGGRGGASLADFDTLIELIKTTVAPDSWDDAGGVGAAEPFPTGVLVDSNGTLRRVESASTNSSLARMRRAALVMSGNREVRQKSLLRKVSLTRLERQAHRLWALGRMPDEAMRMLAGLTHVQYVFVYPDSRDVVIAGPADDWTNDGEGRVVGVESRQPVLRLDDLVVVLRNASSAAGRFGCSINPRRENLASVQAYLDETSRRSLRPDERDRWLAQLRERLGEQDVEVFGIDPRTRVARTLVEADYRMKLVGMGLEPGTMGVTSYLDSVQVPPGGSPPPMDVLRWWFTLNFEPTRATASHDAFELIGTGVKVMSENELLAERGERVHTGESSNLNRQFALSFTKHFPELAVKYPVYAELRNVFELAMVAAVIRDEDLAARCDWQQTFFGNHGKYVVQADTAPKQVASIMNHRVIDRRHVVVGVSGGVSVDTKGLAGPSAIKIDNYGLMSAEHSGAKPPQIDNQVWWWD